MRRLMLAALAGTLGMLGGPAAAGETVGPGPAANPVIVPPHWYRRPTGADAWKVYPSKARRRGVAGGAIIACGVTAEGTLSDCQVLDEAPAGMGFGEAALKLAPKFLMRPLTKDGVPVAGGTVRIPLRFIPRR